MTEGARHIHMMDWEMAPATQTLYLPPQADDVVISGLPGGDATVGSLRKLLAWLHDTSDRVTGYSSAEQGHSRLRHLQVLEERDLVLCTHEFQNEALEALALRNARGARTVDLAALPPGWRVSLQKGAPPTTVGGLQEVAHLLGRHSRPDESLPQVTRRLVTEAATSRQLSGTISELSQQFLGRVESPLGALTLLRRRLESGGASVVDLDTQPIAVRVRGREFSAQELWGAINELNPAPGESLTSAARRARSPAPPKSDAGKWMTRDGRLLCIDEMSTRHIVNTIAMLDRVGGRANEYANLKAELHSRGAEPQDMPQARPTAGVQADAWVRNFFAQHAEEAFGCTAAHIRARKAERRPPIRVTSGNLAPESVRAIEARFLKGDLGPRVVCHEPPASCVTAEELRASRNGKCLGVDAVPYPDEDTPAFPMGSV